MNIIKPINVTDSMIGAGTTLAEDTISAWVSGTYAIGDERYVLGTHRVYACTIAGTSSISPELDPSRWLDKRPTNKWAPFDYYTSTKAKGVTSFTYVLNPGYFNALALYGLTGTSYVVTIKDTTGGTVIFTQSGLLYGDPVGWYEYLFGGVSPLDKLILSDLPIRPTAELTITVSNSSGQPVELGMIVIGDYLSLSGTTGGTQYGASAEPITYSYIKTNDDGTTTIVKRHSATNLRVTVKLATSEADASLFNMQSVLDVPVAWIATNQVGYSGLTTFGIGSGTMSYANPGFSNFEINVKGLI